MIKKVPPCLIVMRGLSGSGKSYLATKLAKKLPAIHLNSDIIRKRLAGYAPLTRTKTRLGKGIYTPQMSYKTYQNLLESAEVALKLESSVVVDATFLHPKSLAKQQKLAKKLAVDFIIIDVCVSVACLRQRVEQRFAKGDDPSEADISVLELQLVNYQPLKKTAKHILTIYNEANFQFSSIQKQLLEFPCLSNLY